MTFGSERLRPRNGGRRRIWKCVLGAAIGFAILTACAISRKYQFDRFGEVARVHGFKISSTYHIPQPGVNSLGSYRDIFLTVGGVLRSDETELPLSNSPFLRQLQWFGRMNTLDLSHSNVVDEDVQRFSLSELQNLYLCDTRVRGSSFPKLAGCPQLKQLWVSRAPLDSADFKQLVALSNLTVLLACNTPIDDQSAADIATLYSLEILDVSNSNVTSIGLVRLLQLPRLRKLYANRLAVDDSVLAAPVASPSLQVVELYETNVTALAIERFEAAHRSILVNSSRKSN